MIFWLTDKNLIFVSGCLSSVDISAPQLRLWSLRLAWFLHHPQLQLLDPSVWSSDWPMDSVMSRVVLKVSVRKVLCVVGLFWQWLCNQPIFLFVQPRWPTAPFMQILITLSQRCSGILCTLRSEYWRGLIPTLSWLLEDAGQLLTPTLTVFLSGTCWLMGKSECWSDLRDKHVWAFKKKKCYTQLLCHLSPLFSGVPTGMIATWQPWFLSMPHQDSPAQPTTGVSFSRCSLL